MLFRCGGVKEAEGTRRTRSQRDKLVVSIYPFPLCLSFLLSFSSITLAVSCSFVFVSYFVRSAAKSFSLRLPRFSFSSSSFLLGQSFFFLHSSSVSVFSLLPPSPPWPVERMSLWCPCPPISLFPFSTLPLGCVQPSSSLFSWYPFAIPSGHSPHVYPHVCLSICLSLFPSLSLVYICRRDVLPSERKPTRFRGVEQLCNKFGWWSSPLVEPEFAVTCNLLYRGSGVLLLRLGTAA